MLQMADMKKLTWYINTALLGIVAVMAFLFAYFGVTYMVWHSIPTIAAYIAMYGLIRRNKLDVYVLVIYIVITAYMAAGTVCLGFDAGYQMYCASLIPLAFYMSYLGDMLHTRKLNAMVTSLLLVLVFLVSTSFALIHGPIYDVDKHFIYRCMVGNSVAVFCFLIGYTSLIHKLVGSTEKRLAEMAHRDQLTGLFNRHYMMTYMDELCQQMPTDQWIAMLDIDEFKVINDTYGHHGGDYVLTELTRIMRQVCGDCVIARWGGEEFLIVTNGTAQEHELIEKLRQAVAEATFVFEDQIIPVTITAGIADYEAGQSIDKWIQSADRKMYLGKNSGKNQVVY